MNIYNKKTLKIVARPYVDDLESFKNNPRLFYPDFNPLEHIYSEINFNNPIIDGDKIREMTKEELYARSLYILAENEIIKDNKIITVELGKYEKIEDNKVVYNIEFKKSDLFKELSSLKVEYSEREFIYKGKYKQKNRELDKNNLTGIVTMLIATKQVNFEGWKFKDLEGNDVYVLLTLEDMQALAVQMMQQTTKAMKCESALIERINGMTEEELKEFNTRLEFETLFEASGEIKEEKEEDKE